MFSGSLIRNSTRATQLIKGSSHFTIRSFSAGSRPFRVLGLQQVAIGGLDKKPLTDLWGDLLGLEEVGTFKSQKENVDEDIFHLGKGPTAVELDLMAPLDPNVAPKVHMPPLNHIGIWVDPLPAAVEWLTQKGMRFTPGGIRRGASGHDVCFIHPKGNEKTPLSGQGVLLELVQAPPEVIAEFDKH
uniref:VOC domain-containing protein n=1 Tax=Fibrocapsa japonica TaxID=94617 RepID=A0A7S2XWR1_9STRA|mmetsp:Transcript_1683/g.2344  ORF Transcript_1683/g.2344 Transcript_1683/m.2344 type:complete len:186 (+) Transcript_1683:51-608(+)